MDINDYLNKVAYQGVSRLPNDDGDIYYSNFDGSYITRVGMEDDVKFLADLEITDKLTHGVGFSPLHNKWFGWSHRAIGGFTIGSKCEKGDCHYTPENIEDASLNELSFWEDEYHEWTTSKIIDSNTLEISWKYNNEVPNEKLRGTTNSRLSTFGNFGRGEWIAETMEDAKQMAIDFSEGVS